MSAIRNAVRRSTYLDSIVLMRISRQVAALPGVEEAGLVIGTPANKEILREARILGREGDEAEPGDLILALRANDGIAAEAALAEAKRLLDQPAVSGTSSSQYACRSIRGAIQHMPDANLALNDVEESEDDQRRMQHDPLQLRPDQGIDDDEEDDHGGGDPCWRPG